MASVSNNWLSLFLPALNKYGDRTILRPYLSSSPEPAWGTITFQEWARDLAALTQHYRTTLGPTLTPGDIIGVWLTGRKASDLLHICALAAVGFIPQLFSCVFTPTMVVALLKASGAKGVIRDPEACPDASLCAVPVWDALTGEEISKLGCVEELRVEDVAPVCERDICVVFHSSGTTAGVPKLIPTTHLSMKTFIEHKFPDCLIGEHDASSYIYNSLGSLAHIGSFQCFIATAVYGACTVQASSMAMTPAEMLHMVRACGLTTLVQYGTFVSAHIRAAQESTEVREVLTGLRQVLYTGVALPAEDERWALEQSVRLSMMFGTTETAPLLVAKPGTGAPLLLRPCAGASPIFIPYNPSDTSNTPSQIPSLTPPTDTTRPPLYELIVSITAPDCPPPSLCSADGHWHTHDLFERVGEGWIHRGRADDWIKTVPGLVNTRAIEERARGAPHVRDALVVGEGRLHPALVVEADADADDVARGVVAHLSEDADVLFPYEQISDPRWVVVVPPDGIVRTREKGNARRRATEEKFKAEIDAIFN